MYDHAAADAHGRDSSLVWTIVVDHRVSRAIREGR